MFEYSLDVYDEDLECWDKDGLTDEQLIDHFAFIGSEAKRHQEVTIRSLGAEDKAELLKAKQKELDHSHGHYRQLRAYYELYYDVKLIHHERGIVD